MWVLVFTYALREVDCPHLDGQVNLIKRPHTGDNCASASALPGNVTCVGDLGFPETEIKRKPQHNFQTNFIKLMLEHKGDSTRKERPSKLAQGLALFGYFYKLHKTPDFLKKMGFLYQ